MKAAMNGVPQLSIMDGWWIEGFNGRNGWSIGHEEAFENQNRIAAAEIYRILEEEIIPLYYRVSEDGTPNGWVKVMKESIKSNGARFSARRMVKEYIEKFYARAIENL
jgi:starch phosphorylase